MSHMSGPPLVLGTTMATLRAILQYSGRVDNIRTTISKTVVLSKHKTLSSERARDDG